METSIACTDIRHGRTRSTWAGLLLLLGVLLASAQRLCADAPLFHDSFTTLGATPDLQLWTESGASSFLGQTQLAQWRPSGAGQFTVAPDGAHLALHTFNPTGFSFYGTHGKTIRTFQPIDNESIIFKTRMRLTSLQRGLVYGVSLYECASAPACARHDEIDIQLVTNHLQPGGPLLVHLNSYADEPLGAGHGSLVPLPDGFNPLAWHEWEIRWSRARREYLLDGTLLFTGADHVPQGPMQANVIVWVPASDWLDAYDASLQPARSSQQNQEFLALLSSATVTTVSAGAPSTRAASASLSIARAFDPKTYGDGRFAIGQSWTLELAGAARAPWNGQTDRGLRIGDASDRFHSLYAAAHRPAEPVPGYYYCWPTDFDVWDVGPLRVVMRAGRVAMIEVAWGFANDTPGPDIKESARIVIGPSDRDFRWY